MVISRWLNPPPCKSIYDRFPVDNILIFIMSARSKEFKGSNFETLLDSEKEVFLLQVRLAIYVSIIEIEKNRENQSAY